MLPPFLIAIGLLSALLIPFVGVTLCATVLMIQLAIIVIRTLAPRGDAPHCALSDPAVSAVFSVHVATHNEPPVMVTKTLQALAAQRWPSKRYEVIVMDNNTTDTELWQPIQRLCAQLGPKFRFLHQMDVKGAKAGALNLALAETSSDATHIVTVDADYIVDRDFLDLAAQALQKTNADYVQFPQAYSGCETIAKGIDAELEEYFRTNAQMADEFEAVLLTGTLCIISKEALEKAGGWSGHTTTEDAEMGVRLCRNGFSGRFVNKIVGRGFLPFTLRDLEHQRHRWASGNLQTLISHAPAIFLGRDGMGWLRRGAIFSQLTAWLNLSFIPALLLLGSILTGQGGQALPQFAAAAVLLCFADIVGRLAWRGLRDQTAADVLVAAIAHRLALAPISALAAIEVLSGKKMRFNVTDKSGRLRGRAYGVPVASLVLFAAAATSMPSALQNSWLTTAAIIALMTPFPAALATARTLNQYRISLIPPLEGAAT